MTPRFAGAKATHGRLTATELHGNIGLSAFCCHDSSDLFLGQLRQEAIFSTLEELQRLCVGYVLKVGHVFKIAQSVVGSYGIDVINFMVGWIWANESLHHYAVNEPMSSRAVFEHGDCFISHVEPLAERPTSTVRYDSAPVRDEIPALISNYREPSFLCIFSNIHNYWSIA